MVREPIYKARRHDKAVIAHLLARPCGGTFSDPGTGKTGQVLAAFHVLKKKKLLDRLLVVAPLNPIHQSWPGEIVKWGFPYQMTILHGPKKDRLLGETDTDIYGINYDGLAWLKNHLDRLLAKGDRWWLVLDECFVGSTLVETAHGLRRIDSIKPGDFVLSSNGQCEPVRRVYRKFSEVLVKLVLSDGSSITCTPNHPFFTDLGWVCAGNLAGRRLYDPEAVRVLQKRVPCEIRDFDETKKILREILRFESKMGSARESRSMGESNVERCVAQISVKPQNWDTAHPRKQGQGEPCSQKDATSPDDSWWERAYRSRTTNAGTILELAMENGISHQLGEKAAWLSNLLQGRLGIAGEKDRYRGGWGDAQSLGGESTGFEENQNAGKTRVESVTYLEQRSAEAVYDLEIDGPCPHYFANGYLVHNSHKVKHTNTTRFKVLRPMLPRFHRRTILSGTPRPNGLMDLFGQVYCLDLGEALGRYITHFRRNYFYPSGYGGYDWIPQKDAEEKVYAKLKGMLIRVDEKVLDLPPINEVPVHIELPEEARKTYRELEKEFVAELENATIVAANAGVKSAKLRQAANGFLYDKTGVWHALHDEKIEAISNLVESLDSPLLVGYEFEADAERLAKALGDVPIVKDYSAAKRPALFAEFNAGKLPVLLAQTGSVSLGVNLQEACHHVAFFGLTWKLDDYIQFRKRVHRSGQKRSVTVHHIVARNTIEDRVMWPCLMRKEAGQMDFFTVLKQAYSIR